MTTPKKSQPYADKTVCCRICGLATGVRICEECAELNERLNTIHRKEADAPRIRFVDAGTENDTRTIAHAARVAPVVLYGLLTAADVTELERRREKFERMCMRMAALMFAAAEIIPDETPAPVIREAV